MGGWRALALLALVGAAHALARGGGAELGPAADAQAGKNARPTLDSVLGRVARKYFQPDGAATPLRPAAPRDRKAAAAALNAHAKNVSALAKVAKQGAPNALAVAVSSTLSGLGQVLHKMYDQVRADEQTFQAFKAKLLEQEVAKAQVDLNWPAIKDLVRTEVLQGKHQVQDQISQFKVDVLDVVQKGLDSLRSDLRATITSSKLAKAKAAELAKDSVDGDLDNKAKKGGAALTRHLDRFLKKLDGVNERAKQDIRSFVVSRAKESERRAGELDSYGEDAARALAQMEAALAGKLSIKDMRSEIFVRLQQVTSAYLRNPTPAGKQALERLRATLVAGLKKLQVKLSARERKLLLDDEIARLERKREQARLQRKRANALKRDKPLDALARAAERAVAEAERAAAQEGDVQKISASIKAANANLNSLTREVTRRVHKSLDKQGQFAATRPVAQLPQNGAAAVLPL